MNMATRSELWDRINEYVVACGGDPSRYEYGNTPRQKAVVAVEAAVDDALAAAAQAAVDDALFEQRRHGRR